MIFENALAVSGMIFLCLMLNAGPSIAGDFSVPSADGPSEPTPGMLAIDEWIAESRLATLSSDASSLISPFRDGGLIESDTFLHESPGYGDPSLWHRIVSDHHNYYDIHSFKLLAGGFFVGAIVANTQFDQEIQDHAQTSVRGSTSDEWYEALHANKELGNGMYTLPLFATAWAVGKYFDKSPFMATTGRWGERSLRTFLVGAPPLILAQRLTGGSRPGESDHQSGWVPLRDNNGISGHAFMAALPFINAAKMTDRPFLKATFFAGSLLGPLSRVNDNAHYPSQVALGWWMAYVASSAIDRTEMANSRLELYPYLTANGNFGGMLELRF